MTVTKTKTEKPIPKLQPNPFQFEILELASKQRTNAKKIEVLQEYRNDALITLMIMNYDTSVISALPEGAVPYASADEQSSMTGNLTDLIESKTKNEGMKSNGYYGTEDFVNETTKTSIRNEYQNFYIYVRGGNDTISQIRKETIFINMLQGLHPLEAELMCLVKDKKITSKYNISFDVVKEAYPDIVWGGRS
jgi:hypothetical protein